MWGRHRPCRTGRECGQSQEEVALILRKSLMAFGLGVVWLYVFSIPVDAEKRIFDVGYEHMVNIKPVHWMVGKVRNYFDETSAVAGKSRDAVKELYSNKEDYTIVE